MRQFFAYNLPFTLESGEVLPKLEIAYHTYGQYEPGKKNVVWVFHALTANSDPCEWWPGLFGDQKIFDPSSYFIVCANILGSCYGSSGPLNIDPKTGKPFFHSFPEITIRDMVRAHQLLQHYLGITKINFAIGGSMGGYQLLEWAITDPTLFENCILLATASKESAWGIAIHTTQRMAIESDSSWKNSDVNAGKNGLKTARGIGMLTYRNYETFVRTQSNSDHEHLEWKAASYIQYQGEKLAQRFNAISYWKLSKAMDSHNVARGRNESAENILHKIEAKTLMIGISSDILCPVPEQEFLHKNIRNSELTIISSSYGHDGFLVESEQIANEIRACFEVKS